MIPHSESQKSPSLMRWDALLRHFLIRLPGCVSILNILQDHLNLLANHSSRFSSTYRLGKNFAKISVLHIVILRRHEWSYRRLRDWSRISKQFAFLRSYVPTWYSWRLLSHVEGTEWFIRTFSRANGKESSRCAPALMHRWFTASYCRVGVLWLRLVTGTDVDCATITSPDTTYLVLP